MSYMMSFIIKAVCRFIYHVALFLLVSLPLMLIGAIVLIPFIALGYKIGSLPIVVRWFDSVDPYVGRDTTVITRVNNGQFWDQYSPLQLKLNRYMWLAFRNPINYFTYKYLGFVWGRPEIVVKGDSQVGDSAGKHEGLCYTEVRQDNKTYYEYYYIKKITNSSCIRFRFGYKIGDITKNKPGDIQQEVLVFQIFKSYTGV